MSVFFEIVYFYFLISFFLSGCDTWISPMGINKWILILIYRKNRCLFPYIYLFYVLTVVLAFLWVDSTLTFNCVFLSGRFFCPCTRTNDYCWETIVLFEEALCYLLQLNSRYRCYFHYVFIKNSKYCTQIYCFLNSHLHQDFTETFTQVSKLFWS